jgi:hypothetical protein
LNIQTNFDVSIALVSMVETSYQTRSTAFCSVSNQQAVQLISRGRLGHSAVGSSLSTGRTCGDLEKEIVCQTKQKFDITESDVEYFGCEHLRFSSPIHDARQGSEINAAAFNTCFPLQSG